jgi:ActR/RegA family two-component response regulator
MVEHTAERRALIVEDETLFAMSLSVDMQALGFANCDLAATGQDVLLKGDGGFARYCPDGCKS